MDKKEEKRRMKEEKDALRIFSQRKKCIEKYREKYRKTVKNRLPKAPKVPKEPKPEKAPKAPKEPKPEKAPKAPKPPKTEKPLKPRKTQKKNAVAQQTEEPPTIQLSTIL
jgi:putative endonuclease